MAIPRTGTAGGVVRLRLWKPGSSRCAKPLLTTRPTPGRVPGRNVRAAAMRTVMPAGSGEHVDDERDVDEPGPRPHIGEVGDPHQVERQCGEVAIEQVPGTGPVLAGIVVGCGGPVPRGTSTGRSPTPVARTRRLSPVSSPTSTAGSGTCSPTWFPTLSCRRPC
jgi:hypothetical protein